MTAWRHTLAVARRRAGAQRAVAAAAAAAPFAAGAALAWVAIAAGRDQEPLWPWIAAAVATAILAAAVIGFARRPSPLAAAVALDRHANLNDALSTALQLSSKPDHTPFERRAIADADTAAAAANPTAAFPCNLRRPLYLSAAAALLFAAAPFIPPGWPAQAMNLAGLRDGPPKADVQAALADTRAAEHLLRAVTPPAPETSTQAAAAPTERPDPLADLRQQLERGQLTPKEATQQAATTLERAADRLDQQAADAQAAQDLLRDRLALAHRSRDPASDQHTASKFTRALERGDLQRAAEEADRLAQAADALSPQDRAKLAEELKGVADALQRAAPSQAPTPPQTPDTPTPTPQPTPPNPATAPAEKPPEQQADRQVKDLADKLRRAADQLDRPATPRPEQPPSPMPQRPPHQERTPQADQPQTTPREPEPTSQQPAQAQPPRPQQGGPQPGQPPEEPVSEPGDPNQPADRPSNESQPPRQPRPNAQPQQQQPGRKPDPTAATKPQPSPTEHQGRQQQPPDQSADPDPPGGKQPGNPRDQQAPGAQPHPGDQQQPFNEPPKTDKPQPSDQPGGSPTPPEKLPPLDQLRDTLKQIADQQSRPRQDRQDAQSLREQAQKLWNNATPEQRKQMEQLARELAQRRSGRPDDQPSGPPSAPGDGNTRDLAQQPDSHAPGDGPRPPRDNPLAATPAPAGTAHDIDARSTGDEHGPSQVIAEWLTSKPSPRTGGPAATAPPGVARAVEQARQNAEQALQQRTVPARLSPLIRRYFDRLPQAVGSAPAPATPPPPAAPAPPAPATKP